MAQTPFKDTYLYSVIAPLIGAPREAWKRLVNIFRGVQDISPQEAYRLIKEESAFILDVREQSEYDAGHVANSMLVPLGSLTSRVSELELVRQSKIVVICHGGKRSATACAQLAEHGFGRTYNIAGGILEWRKQKLPVVQ